MSMFTRNAITYEYDPAVVGYILGDEANPLRRIAEVISAGSKVLDVGAGNGILAVVMKALGKEVTIDGIELDTHAASIASKHYRFFRVGHVQEFKALIQQERYDYIVMADVLEHFQDPQAFLQELVAWICPETRILISIPNVAFGSVRLELLNGNFNYVDSGLLEKTHLRFFTLETLRQLAASCCLSIEKLFFLQRDFLAVATQQNLLSLGWGGLLRLLQDETASAYQFIAILSLSVSHTEIKYYGTTAKVNILSFIASKIKKGLRKIKGR